MRILLSLTAVLCTITSVANAEFVFDDFSTGRGLSNSAATMGTGAALGGTAMDAVAGGTRTATITGSGTDWREGGYNNVANGGPAFLNLTDPNQHAMRNNVGGGTITLNYDLAADFDFTNTATEFLQFHLFENVTPGGTWNYTVEVADGASVASLSGAVIGGSPPGGVLNFEDSDFGAPLTFASTIDRISIMLSGPNGGGLGRTNSGLGARIIAVPEPSAIALLGLTGIGGVIFARRRRKTEKEQKSV